ncbi:MAG: T9SS type A sorting domain-containing protein [Ignavibacteria bacterium]|nr:T9SS type A sorting domain-containing protein [Ignavibacteria bacterium]
MKRQILFMVLITYLISLSNVICQINLKFQQTYPKVGQITNCKLCKLENNKMFLAISNWFPDTTELMLAILDKDLNLLEVYKKIYTTGFYNWIYCHEDFIEYYGVYIAGDNLEWWYDFQFMIERFDYSFMNIFSSKDTTFNLMRYNVNQIPMVFRKKNGTYICNTLMPIDTLTKLIYFVEIYDSLGNFVKEVVYDTSKFSRRSKYLGYFNKDEYYIEFHRLPHDSLDYPPDNFALKIYSPDFEKRIKTERVSLIGDEVRYGSYFHKFNKDGKYHFIFPSTYVTGKTNIIVLDDWGNLIDKKLVILDTNYIWYFQSDLVLSSGDILFGGWVYDPSQRNYCGFVVKLNKNLEVVDKLIFNCGRYFTYFFDFLELENGSVLASGSKKFEFWIGVFENIVNSVEPSNNAEGYAKVITRNKSGKSLEVIVEINPSEIIKSIKICDVLGNELLNKNNMRWNSNNENRWSETFDIVNLSSGVYFIVVETTSKIYTTKFVHVN